MQCTLRRLQKASHGSIFAFCTFQTDTAYNNAAPLGFSFGSLWGSARSILLDAIDSLEPVALTLERAYLICSERFGRPLIFDMALPSTSLITAGSQYLSGLLLGRPPSSRCIYQHAGHNSFIEWLRACPEEVVVYRRSTLFQAASFKRRHGHLQKAPVSLVSLNDPRAPPAHIEKVLQDRVQRQSKQLTFDIRDVVSVLSS